MGGDGVKVSVRLGGRTIAACGKGRCNGGTADGGWGKLGEYHCGLVVDGNASAEGCLEAFEESR